MRNDFGYWRRFVGVCMCGGCCACVCVCLTHMRSPFWYALLGLRLQHILLVFGCCSDFAGGTPGGRELCVCVCGSAHTAVVAAQQTQQQQRVPTANCIISYACFLVSPVFGFE